MDFQQVSDLFKNDNIRELSLMQDGMKFLKLRSLSRKEQLEYLINKTGLDFGTNSKQWLKLLYQSDITNEVIDQVIHEIYDKERAERRKTEDNLVSELYKIQSFGWGGLHQNSLEKTIVDNYVKKIKSFDELNNAVDNELYSSMRAYVLSSWYNHWTSIIIEDIFKDHHKVIPAVGLIKKIDFFVNNKPYDLKVTYLPEGYIKDYRKSNGLRPELTLMKGLARTLKITYDQTYPDSFLIPDLWRKLEDHPDSSAKMLIKEMHDYRKLILDNVVRSPKHLVRWLYENQGVRRFDASNRLFLVLVDINNFFESWKLKRAKSLISSQVNNYLDTISNNSGFELTFNWEGKRYTTESGAIFVLKE